MEERPAGTTDDALETRPREHWLEPILDVLAIPADSDPFEQARLRQGIRLAFVAAPPRDAPGSCVTPDFLPRGLRPLLK